MVKENGSEDIAHMWKVFRKTGDGEIRDELITRHLHLVKFVVGRLGANFPSHIRSEDLYSTGIIGLIRAVERYDPSFKTKFETYAILLIKGAIIDELRALDWVPRSIHQKANLISKAQHALQQAHGRDPTDEELAEYLNIDLDQLDEMLAKIQPAILISLNEVIDDDEDKGTMADRIPDQKAKTSFEIVDRKELGVMLEEAIIALPDKERMVLVLYYYENLMLKEIGEVLGVSESRISQIHSKAVIRLRTRLQDIIKDYVNII